MDMRRIGIILVVVGMAILALTYLFKLQEDRHLEQISIDNGTCFVNGDCVYEERDFTLYIAGGFLGAFILFLGTYFLLFETSEIANRNLSALARSKIAISESAQEHAPRFSASVLDKPQIVASDKSSALKEIDASQLNDEELKVYDYLKEHNGSAYQSELARDLELTKVKMTRILDRLEGFGVLERKRRGMTNIVILRSL